MKKLRLPALALISLLLCSCAQSAPVPAEPLPPSPAVQEQSAETPAEETPLPVPDALELSCSLPRAEDAAYDCLSYFSGAEELDCAFCYPEHCELWVEDGVIRLSPRTYFARVFLSSIRKDSEDAPDGLLGLLDTAKWGSTANETTVGGRYDALRMSNWKYDTYRRWIVWETDERYYTLYASCFDRYEDNTNAILDAIASSFLASADCVSANVERGGLLRSCAGLSLYYDGAALETDGDGAILRLNLRAVDSTPSPASITAAEAVCELAPGESVDWPLRLSLAGQSPCQLSARLGDESLETFALDLLIKES